MMVRNHRFPWSTFLLSIVFASLLTFVPIPSGLQWFRPDWVLLLLVYWMLSSQAKMPLVVGFGVGIFQDVLLGSLLGSHALAYLTALFVAQYFYTRLKFYTQFQLLFMVVFLIGMSELIQIWIYAFQFGFPQHLHVWGTTLVTLIAWPLLKLVTYQFRSVMAQ